MLKLFFRSLNLSHFFISEIPPPLPPRLPSRSNLNLPTTDRYSQSVHSDHNSQSALSDRNSQSAHSDRFSQPSVRAETQSESSKSSKPNRSSNKCNDVNFDKFSVGGLNCSSPHPALPSLNNRGKKNMNKIEIIFIKNPRGIDDRLIN